MPKPIDPKYSFSTGYKYIQLELPTSLTLATDTHRFFRGAVRHIRVGQSEVFHFSRFSSHPARTPGQPGPKHLPKALTLRRVRNPRAGIGTNAIARRRGRQCLACSDTLLDATGRASKVQCEAQAKVLTSHTVLIFLPCLGLSR